MKEIGQGLGFGRYHEIYIIRELSKRGMAITL
jgi:hypothetical protein